MEVLLIHCDFICRLSVGVLPSSIVHLVLTQYDKELEPHILPQSLQRLDMAAWNNHPLSVEGECILPSNLKALQLPRFNQTITAGELPCGLTHLRFQSFDNPLEPGILPDSLVHLELLDFSQPLSPSLLPSSLRVFFHHAFPAYPLRPGVYPEGLAILQLRWDAEQHPSFHGVLPSSLRVLDLGGDWEGELVASDIPTGMRWMRLPLRLREWGQRHLPHSIRVLYQ